MVGGFGKEVENVVWAAVALEHDTPLTSCVGYWVNSLIPCWSFPSRIWVCNFPLSQCYQWVMSFVQEKFNQMSQSYTSAFYRSSSVSLVPWSAKCRNFHLRLIDHLLSQSYISPSNHFVRFASWERIHHCLSLTDLFSSTSTHHLRLRSRNPKQHPRPACLNGRYPCHRQ